jgi:hypothetical protein
MDEIPNEPVELNSKEALQARMERARRDISETVGDLRTEVSEALDWQTYVRRYPARCLLSGGVIGLLIGRALKGGRGSNAGASSRFYRSEPPIAAQSGTQESVFNRLVDVVLSAAIAEAGLLAYRALNGLSAKRYNSTQTSAPETRP